MLIWFATVPLRLRLSFFLRFRLSFWYPLEAPSLPPLHRLQPAEMISSSAPVSHLFDYSQSPLWERIPASEMAMGLFSIYSETSLWERIGWELFQSCSRIDLHQFRNGYDEGFSLIPPNHLHINQPSFRAIPESIPRHSCSWWDWDLLYEKSQKTV